MASATATIAPITIPAMVPGASFPDREGGLVLEVLPAVQVGVALRRSGETSLQLKSAVDCSVTPPPMECNDGKSALLAWLAEI